MEKITEKQQSSHDKYIKSLQYYFRIKKRYENNKDKCISCKKQGGTIFEYTNNQYKARCGSTSETCKLNIVIQIGKYISKDVYKKQVLKQYNDIKKNIIELKMDYLFHFTSEEKMIEIFDKQKEELTRITNVLDTFQKKIDALDILQTKQDIIIYREKIKEHIHNIKSYMNVFHTTREYINVKEATYIYKHDLLPLLEQYKTTFYKYVNIEKNKRLSNEKNGGERGQITHTLIKKINSIHDNEVTIIEPKIIAFTK